MLASVTSRTQSIKSNRDALIKHLIIFRGKRPDVRENFSILTGGKIHFSYRHLHKERNPFITIDRWKLILVFFGFITRRSNRVWQTNRSRLKEIFTRVSGEIIYSSGK